MNTRIVAIIISLFAATMAAKADGHTPEERLAEAGHALPAPTTPIANYVTWRRTGNILYLSGHGECGDDDTRGKLGADVSMEAGYKAAQNTGLCMLATIKSAVGELSNVKQVLQIMGMVNATADFTAHPKVINGFSDMFVVAFGDAGKGARAAVGMNSLPGDIAVEISAIVELHQ